MIPKTTQNYPKLIAFWGTRPESGHNTYDSAFFQGKGDWNEATFKKNQEVMANLWNEIAELADFNKVNYLVLGFLIGFTLLIFLSHWFKFTVGSS